MALYATAIELSMLGKNAVKYNTLTKPTFPVRVRCDVGPSTTTINGKSVWKDHFIYEKKDEKGKT